MKRLSILLVVSLSFIGCGGGASSSPTPGATPGSPNLLRVSTTPGDATTIILSQQATFHATAFYGDGTSQDVTQTGTWTSSVPAVAPVTLNSSGAIVNGSTLGQSVVTVAFSGMTYDVGVTVALTDPGPGPTPPPPPPTPVLAALTPLTGSPALTVQSGTAITLATTGLDQFGHPIAFTPQQNFIWNTNSPNATLSGCGTASCHVQMAACVAPCSSLSALVTVILQNSGISSGLTQAATLTVTAGPPPPPPIPTRITISPTTATILPGATQTFTAAVFDQNNAPMTAGIIWSSTLPVTQAGVVTGVNSGSTTISGSVTATVSGTNVSSSATVSVSSVPSVQDHCVLTPAVFSLNPGATQQMTVVMIDQYGHTMPPQYSSGATWNATGPIAVISGLVTASATASGQGSVTAVFVAAHAINCSATVSVAQVLKTVSVTPPSLPIYVGQTRQMTASAFDQSGASFPATFVWAATGGTISASGLFTATTAGPASVTATASGISGTSNFSVTAVALAQISLTPVGPVSGLSGSTVTLSAAGKNNDGTNNALSSLIWASSNTTYVTVSGGLVHLSAPTNVQGQATVTASQSGVTSNGVLVTVNPSAPVLSQIQVNPDVATILTGKSQQFTAKTLDQYGAIFPATVTWSATGNLTVTPGGLATSQACLAASSATVTATSGSISGSADVSITPAPSVLTTVTISPGTATISVGSTQQMTATKRDQCNNIVSAATTWASSNPAAATVSASGLVSGVFQGNSNVTATSSGVISPAATINVNNVPPPTDAVHSISVTPPSSTITATVETKQLTATAFNATNQVVAATFTWSSSNPAIATVSQAGLVSGVSASGTVQIIASTETEGINGTTVTVTSTAAIVNVSAAPQLKTLTVTPTSVSLPQFATQQFSAFGKDQYGNPISASVTWHASNGVCQIDSGGLLTAVLAGSCLVTASSGAIVSPAATVNVSTVFSLQGPWEFTTNTGYSVELNLANTVPGPVTLIAGKLFDASFGRPVDGSGNFGSDFWWGTNGNVVSFSGSNSSNNVSLAVANSQGFGISITGTLSSNTQFSGSYVINSPSGPISGSITGAQIGPPTTSSGGWTATGGIFNPVSVSGCGLVHIFLPDQIGPFDWSGSDTCAAISDAAQIGSYVHFNSGSFSFAGHMTGNTLTIFDDKCYTVSNQSQCGAGGTMGR